MTEQQQSDLLHDEVQAGTTTGLASPSVDVTSSRQNSLWSDAWAQLRRSVMFWTGAVLGLIFVLMAVFPSLFARGIDPRDCDLSNSKGTPTGAHWLGDDPQGCGHLAKGGYRGGDALLVGFPRGVGVVVLRGVGGGV